MMLESILVIVVGLIGPLSIKHSSD